MSEESKAVNKFFKFALQEELDNLIKEGAWDDIESKLLFERYLEDKEKRKTIVTLCRELNMSPSALHAQLDIIRRKVLKWQKINSVD